MQAELFVPSTYRCLGCNDPLPRGRGSFCDACVAWGDDTDEQGPAGIPSDVPNPMDGDKRAVCPHCNDRGPCQECGAVDLLALGREIKYFMRYDRPEFLRILADTPPRFWPLLAHAYVLVIGQTTDSYTQPAAPGVVRLWQMLMAA